MYKIEKYLNELSRRCFLFILSFLFTLGFLYSWSFEFLLFFFDFLDINQMNSQIQSFIFTDITEAFHTFLGMSFTGTLCLQIPYLIYTIWSFFVPSFVDSERKIFTFLTFLFLILYILSFILTLFFLFPKILEFFLSFQLENTKINIQYEPKISTFTSFFWKIFFITQGICQIPFFIFIGLYYQFLSLSFFFSSRKIFYFSILSFCAFLAPPHFFIQFSFSFFIIFIFEITLFNALLFQNYSQKLQTL